MSENYLFIYCGETNHENQDPNETIPPHSAMITFNE